MPAMAIMKANYAALSEFVFLVFFFITNHKQVLNTRYSELKFASYTV